VRIKRKIKTEQQKEKSRVEKEKMWEFYNYLWKSIKGERKCWNCEKRIWGENLSLYHDHLLPKELYPQFKYEEENMFFCCGDCHQNKTNGHPGEKHRKAIELAKQKFLYAK